MRKEYVAKNLAETKKLALELAREIEQKNSQKEATVICLVGELGAGKTTFSQGLLEALGAKGPFTSPTFVIMKKYVISRGEESQKREIFHFDAYRVGTVDILSLGWEEIVADWRNVVIIEWAEKVKDIIPLGAQWIFFEWAGEETRRIEMTNKE
jgi:tRNA threonylcarbamoyladenosine biosynthesis protein TsaE